VSNPQSPWLWRKDWAASRAESKNRNRAFGLWSAAIFVNGIAFTIAFTALPQLWRNSDPKAFFVLVFCAAGVILAGRGHASQHPPETLWPNLLRVRLAAFFSGRTLKGSIHLRFNSDARHGIDLSLSCVRQVITGGGKNRSLSRAFSGKRTRMCARESVMSGPVGTRRSRWNSASRATPTSRITTIGTISALAFARAGGRSRREFFG